MIESMYQKTGYRAGLHLGGHAAAGVWVEVGAVVPAAAHALAVELETKVHPKVRNHGEGQNYGILLVESAY